MKNTKPFISVLMPIYNCEDYIQEAVESILNQTYTNYELIIIDDASTDATVEIIKTYKDERINLIVKPENTGYTNSLNNGLKIAKGKYIARMDGDDISLPTRFEKQVAVLEANPNIVVCGSVFKIIGSNKLNTNPETHEEIKMALLQDSAIGHPTSMLRKSTLEENNVEYDTSMQPAEDYDLWVRLLKYGELYNIQEPLFLYRVHEGQVSNVKRVKQSYNGSRSRFNILTNLKFTYTEEERTIYLKLFTFNERLTFNELVVFMKFKEKLIVANSNAFFNKKGFKEFLDKLEAYHVKKYFIGSKHYTPKVILQLLKILRTTKHRFKMIDVIKIVVKSIIFFKKQ